MDLLKDQALALKTMANSLQNDVEELTLQVFTNNAYVCAPPLFSQC
jgi:hypothetical protein